LFFLPFFFGLSFLTYYSAEALNLALITCVSIIIILAQNKVANIKLRKRFNNLAQLTLAFSIFFLAFENMFIRYLEVASLDRLWQHISNYLDYAKNLIMRNIGEVKTFRPTISNIALLYIDLIMKVSIILSITTYILYFTFHSVKRLKSFRMDHRMIFLLSLIAVSILETLVYWSYGPAGGFRYFYFFAPLLAFYSLHQLGSMLNKKRISIIVILLIFLTAFFKFTIAWQDPNYSYGGRHYYSFMEATANWVMARIKDGNILSDFYISGRLLAEAALHSKFDEIYVYKFYKDIDMLYEYNQTRVNNVFNKNKYNYIILSYAFQNQTIFGDIWAPQGPPLGRALSFFDSYTSFNRIYEDGRGIVYIHR
jgi:hypothetical protein